MKACFFLAGLFLLFKCSQEADIAPRDSGENYYPLDTGMFNTYSVRNIEYTIGNAPDTTYYQLKEVVADTFIDIENQLAYRIERYIRYMRQQIADTQNLSSDWEIDSVWYVKADNQRIVKYENNIPYVKLSFPLAEGKTWDGNLMNAQDVLNYKVQDYDEALTLKGKHFHNTLSVIQRADTASIIERNFSREIYARNTGLIKKVKQRLTYCQPTEPDCNGQIQYGTDYQQVLINYGKK